MTNHDVNGWILTDDDSSQYLKPISECRFDCIEMRKMPCGMYIVVRVVLDLDLVARAELEHIVETYYESVDEVFGAYGEVSAAQIMVECLFEQLGVEEMDDSVVSLSEYGALETVQEMIRN